MMAAREAIWDWIVDTQNWWEIASARDPVVAEARRDFEYAFKVFYRYEFWRLSEVCGSPHKFTPQSARTSFRLQQASSQI